MITEVLTQCLQSQRATKIKRPLQKKVKQQCCVVLKLEEKISFLAYPTFLNQSTQTKN